MKKKIKYLLYGSNLWYLGEGMLGPLFAVFAEKIGGDVLDISWAWSVFLFVSGVMHIVIGKISDDKIKKEHLMILGYALNAFFTFMYLFVSTPFHLLFVQAGLGLSLALADPSWNALYSKYGDDNNRGLEWGLADGEANLITGVAIIIGGFIITFASFKILFIIMGSIQVAATVYQAQILKKQNLFEYLREKF